MRGYCWAGATRERERIGSHKGQLYGLPQSIEWQASHGAVNRQEEAARWDTVVVHAKQ